MGVVCLRPPKFVSDFPRSPHHVPAVTTERVLQTAPARYVTGLTATPYRRGGHHPIIAMQCGPIRHEIDRHTARSGAQLSLRIVRRDTTFDPAVLPTDAGIQEIYATVRSPQTSSAPS